APLVRDSQGQAGGARPGRGLRAVASRLRRAYICHPVGGRPRVRRLVPANNGGGAKSETGRHWPPRLVWDCVPGLRMLPELALDELVEVHHAVLHGRLVRAVLLASI